MADLMMRNGRPKRKVVMEFELEKNKRRRDAKPPNKKAKKSLGPAVNLRNVAVLVWPGTLLAAEQEKEFEKWIKDEIGAVATVLGVVKTLPGQGGPGGRSDLFFTIRTSDIVNFALWRLQYGMRWWEDVVDNGGSDIYPISTIPFRRLLLLD